MRKLMMRELLRGELLVGRLLVGKLLVGRLLVGHWLVSLPVLRMICCLCKSIHWLDMLLAWSLLESKVTSPIPILHSLFLS